MSLLKEIH